MMNEQYERKIISRFIPPDRRSRYEFALPRAKHRHAALVKLFANDHIDLRFAEEYGGLTSLLALSSLGKDTECYIISCDEETDGKVFPLEQAMAIHASLGLIIYCPKEQVAYYRGEHGAEYFLHKPS